MKLLDLPGELLIIIIDHAHSADTFRQDFRLLTLSKRWSQYAVAGFQSRVRLDAAHLARLGNHDGINFSPRRADAVKWLGHNTTTLSIDLNRCSSLSSITAIDYWLVDICQGVRDVTETIRDSARLKDFQILYREGQLLCSREALGFQFPFGIPSTPNRSAWPPSSLNSLDISLSRASCTPCLQQQPDLCDSLRELLPTMKQARLRLPFFCPHLFSSSKEAVADVELQVLVLDTTIKQTLCACCRMLNSKLFERYHSMEGLDDWMAPLVLQMREPRSVRIIGFRNGVELVTEKDCLTGRTRRRREARPQNPEYIKYGANLRLCDNMEDDQFFRDEFIS